MSCEIFSTLSEVLDDKRALWGRRVTMLVLRPPGEHHIVMGRLEFATLIDHLLQNSTESGANSICFSASQHGEELWLKMTDNGWGFAISARGLRPAQLSLLSLGGSLDLLHPKRGSEVILKIPLRSPGYGPDLNKANVLESHI